MLTAKTPTLASAALPDSPYRGIESFRYFDQPIFFARTEETRKLLRYVAIYRGVLFYGGSGCGKSSLINAGFIPAIIDEGFLPDRLRVQPKPGAETVVERISTKDSGEAPYLPSNFIVDDKSSSRVVLSAEKLRERLQELRVSSPERRPLLIFDQFEEFATLFEEAPRGDDIQRAQHAQQAILKLIVDLQRDATLPVKLLFSFREDYLAKLSKLISLWPDLKDQSLRLTPPGTDALPTIIHGSFEKYPGSFGKELSANLTSELVIALKARNEGGKLNLSEVQIGCLQLWKAGDPDALFKSKGLQGLLEDYLSDSLNRLAENLRDPAVALLSRMVTQSGTRNIVSEYDLISKVFEDERIPEDRLKDALQALVQQTKLVRRERRYETFFYDIVSEFLVPWIARQKIDRLADFERRKLEAIERKKRRKAFALALASLIVAIVVGFVAYFVYSKRTVAALALDEVKHAKAEEKRAEDSEKAALFQQTIAERERDEAKNAYASLMNQKLQTEADSKKQYDELYTKYQASQQDVKGALEQIHKLNEHMDWFEAECDNRNERAIAQINQADEALKNTQGEMIELQKQLDPKCSHAYVQVQSKLAYVRSVLRPAASKQ